MNPKVILNNDVDIYDLGYVLNIEDISEVKSFQLDKLVTNNYNLQVNNQDNFFSINNPESYFSAYNYLYIPIKIYNFDNELVWDGIITGITRDHNSKTAIIHSKNVFFKYRKTKVEYQSSDWETPAKAFENICLAYNYTNYDTVYLNNSHLAYVAAGCYIKVHFNLSDGETFQHALEKIGEYGNADTFNHLGKSYFVHWIPYVGTPTISVNADVEFGVKTRPIVMENETELINDYSIGNYNDFGNPAKDVNLGNIGALSRTRYEVHSLPEVRTDQDSDITFKDQTSARYIGESYIKMTHKNLLTQPSPRTQIEMELFADNKYWITLKSFFKFTCSDEGWVDKNFEIYAYSINEDQDCIKIKAYEV